MKALEFIILESLIPGIGLMDIDSFYILQDCMFG
jgi:hypothetical protein